MVSVATQPLAVKSDCSPARAEGCCEQEASISLHAVIPGAMFPIHGQCPSFSILSIENCQMPSLFRFLALIGVVGGLIYGAMFLLATWFDPQPHEITVSIPPDRFAKQP